jgi:spore coat polysaccharide biosynthesis predicted glycosyltransferase SpsG
MQKLNIAFFTEAGSSRGMGHLVRSYTIASYFKKYCDVEFFLDSDLHYEQFKNIHYFKWDNLNISTHYDIIFIDSYIATLTIYEYLKTHSKQLVCIDDYGRLSYPKSIIINFAPQANKYFKYLDDNYLLGLKYLPIRKELQNIKPKKENSIFIMLGGNDIKNLSFEILKTLNSINIKKYIVINNKTKLLQAKKYKNCEILYKPTPKKLYQTMANSTIAITTASMSVYELAYLKIPTFIIAVETNQINGINQLIKYKLSYKSIDINKQNWQKQLYNMLNKKITFKILDRIDKNGTKRIYQKTTRSLNES